MSSIIESNREERVAGFWIRAGAFFIDLIIVGLLQIIMELCVVYFIKGRFLLLDSNNLGLAIAYYVGLTKMYGQTIGKMLLSIQVVDVDGDALTFWGVFYREFIMKFISAILLGFGFFMAAFRKDKRALHDLAASTKVIYKVR